MKNLQNEVIAEVQKITKRDYLTYLLALCKELQEKDKQEKK